MTLNDLLREKGIDPENVLAFRHRPSERELNKVLPWLAAEKPEVFNAYQQTQGQTVENAMTRAGYVAAFIGHEAGKALFVGVYSIGESRSITEEQYWRIPANVELKAFGLTTFSKESRSSILWFDLKLTDFCAEWKGKLIVGWPPPERSWWRRSHRNVMPVLAILEDSALDAAIPQWYDMVLTWEELSVLPKRWKSAFSQWRGIYFIFDGSDGKGYVGSAYGGENLLGRWLNYADSGHGGNRLLRQRDHRTFQFSILQRVSPDMEPDDVIRLEATWKERLHTRSPCGLNDN
jgi:hypothetical protein